MRRTFFTALADVADTDDRIMLLSGDLGWMALMGFADSFTDRHPDKFINCGVAEQNMIGVATGLAKNGYIPFVYSITPFVVLRPLEQILRGPVLHELPVRIVGAGRGQQYFPNGETHYATEAEAVMNRLGVATDYPVNKSDVIECVKNCTREHLMKTTVFVSLSKGGCS